MYAPDRGMVLLDTLGEMSDDDFDRGSAFITSDEGEDDDSCPARLQTTTVHGGSCG